MATQLQIRRGTASQIAAFTGAEGEVVVNTTNDSIVVSDGSTAGGFEMARADLNNVSDTSLNAALTGNTVSALTVTSLTSSGINVTGTATMDGLTVSGTSQITHQYTGAATGFSCGQFNATGDASINNTANAPLLFATNNTERMRIDSSGNVDITTGNLFTDATSGIFFSGGIGSFTNGIYGVGVNNVAINAGGSERMRISANGYVNPKANVANTNAPDTQGLHFGWNYSNGAGESLIVFNKGAGTTGGLTFVDNSSSGTHDEIMRLEGGNLLVGTTSSGSGTPKISVNGSVQTLWGNYRVGTVFDNSFRQGMYFDSTNRNMYLFSTTSDTGGNIVFSTRNAAGSSDADYGTERMRIDGSGNVTIGSVASGVATATPVELNLGSTFANSAGSLSKAKLKIFEDSSGTVYGLSVSNGLLEFGVPGSASHAFYINESEKARISSSGALLVGSTDTTLGGSSVIAAGVESSHTTGAQTMTVYNSSTSCGANGILLVGTARTANTAFDIFNCWTAGIGDKEFKVRGDGNVFADGTFSGGGADYAEFFEWLDGNSSAEDRRGYSVVLDSGKIRVATSEDDASQIIGVISANPAMIGDNDMERWRGKYLRDDFGAYDLDANGDKQLSPDYDEAQPYVPREERVEWDIVGLMGKLRIRKGQPTGSNWIKIKDINAGIEEWLVR